MKASVSTGALASAISNVYPITREKNHFFSGLICLRSSDEETLEILAMSPTMRLKKSISLFSGSLKEILIDGQVFHEYIRDLPSDTIELVVINKALHVTCGGFVCKFHLHENKLTPFEMINKKLENCLGIDSLYNALNKTKFALNNDFFAKNIDGLFLQTSRNKYLKAVATNGYILTEFKTTNSNERNDELEKGILLPASSITDLLKLLKNLSVENARIAIIYDHLVIKKQGDFEINIRLASEEFISLNGIIPKTLEHSFACNRICLLNALKRVSIFSNERSKAIQLKLSRHKIELSSSSSIRGNARECIAVKYNGDDEIFSFSSQNLGKILENILETEVEFKFNHAFSPFLINGLRNKNQINLILPMRI